MTATAVLARLCSLTAREAALSRQPRSVLLCFSLFWPPAAWFDI